MILKVIIHILFGAAMFVSGLAILVAGFDALADGITLFSNAGEIVTIAVAVFVVSAVVLALNMWLFVRRPQSMFKHLGGRW